MFRDLLVHVDGSPAGRRRVTFAADLGVQIGARLTGLHVKPPVEVSPRHRASTVGDVAAQASLNLTVDAKNAASAFREEAQKRLPQALYFEAEGEVAQGISRQARYADMVILGQYESQGVPETHPLPVAHSVVLQCGRPVLIVPANVHARAFQSIALAWDGSREAVRAVHDALPILRLSKSVQIVKVVTPSEKADDTDVRSLSLHLANHGIAVDPAALCTNSFEEHDTLRERLALGRYDLLVMGGYSHPKWLEFLLGGATLSILLSSEIPILVSN